MRVAVIAALALSGCSITKLPPAAVCNADDVQSAVGRVFDATASTELQRFAGARIVRAVRPGEMVTMDFRPDRLTVTLDAAGKITGMTCG